MYMVFFRFLEIVQLTSARDSQTSDKDTSQYQVQCFMVIKYNMYMIYYAFNLDFFKPDLL